MPPSTERDGRSHDFARLLARWRVTLGFVVAALVIVFAAPTWTTWRIGLVVAIVGEAIRVWAAGHLEKSREVTRSGPYRWTRHPLYLGSSVIALGVIVAAHSVVVAVAGVVYMATTIGAAIRTEEAFLKQQFGDTYERYQRSAAEPMVRQFSLARARRNREHRAVVGLVGGFALLALKVMLSV
jgi:protein-S-isoprenylcysteine O-methyltransferase Ste14